MVATSTSNVWTTLQISQWAGGRGFRGETQCLNSSSLHQLLFRKLSMQVTQSSRMQMDRHSAPSAICFIFDFLFCCHLLPSPCVFIYTVSLSLQLAENLGSWPRELFIFIRLSRWNIYFLLYSLSLLDCGRVRGRKKRK